MITLAEPATTQATAFQATLPTDIDPPILSSPLAFSQVLPHMRFPIGTRTENQGTLRCLIDTGASLNVGRTSYHDSIAKTRPDIVHYYGPITDAPGFNPLTIGSVNGDSPSTPLDAIITYKTPYVLNGRPVHLTFALGSSIATNSIVAFPFLQSIKAVLMLENMTLVSSLLGESFPIDPMVPLRSDSAPSIPSEAPSAFHASAPISPQITDLATATYLLEAAPNRL